MCQRPVAFVLMPFASEFEHVYKHLIRPALEAASYDVKRADSDFHQQNILRDVVNGINGAALIVADLTSSNPNVMYEIGLCHGLRKPVVLIAESIEEVPFDLRPYRILTYSTHVAQVDEFKRRLQEIAENRARGTVKFSNPVTEHLGGDVLATALTGYGVTEPALRESSEQVGEPGLLELWAEMEEASAGVVAVLTGLGERTTNIGDRIEGYSDKMRGIAKYTIGRASALSSIASVLAADTREYARAASEDQERLHDWFEKIENHFMAIVEREKGHEGIPEDQAAEASETFTQLLTNTRITIEQLAQFRDAAGSLADMGIARDLTSANNLLRAVLGNLISDFIGFEAFCTRALRTFAPGGNDSLP